MIQTIKKRTLFFLSILVTGVVGVVGSYLRTNYSKDDSLLIPQNDSLFVPTAHADVATCGTCDTGGGCGYGCGK